MTWESLLGYCLAKPGAVQDEPWEGDIVAKVGGKIFAFLGSGGLGVKCGRDADEAEEVRRRFPGSVTRSAYIGQHGWNRIDPAPAAGPAVDDEELRELVDTSYD